MYITKNRFGNIIYNYDITPEKNYINDLEIFFSKIKPFIIKKLRKWLCVHGGVKFRMLLGVQFYKYDIENQQKNEHIAWFPTSNKQIYDKFNLTDKINLGIATITGLFDAYVELGSGWILDKIIHLRLSIFKCNPFGGFSTIKIRKKGVLNIPCNLNNHCFLFCIIAFLYKLKHPERKSDYIKYIHSFKLKNIKFPIRISQIPMFERKNNVSINVFGLFTKKCRPYPMYVSKYSNTIDKSRHINLLLYKKHYCLIKNLSTFLGPYFYKNTRYFCNKCLISFYSKLKYDIHMKQECGNIEYTGQAYIMPKKGEKVFFNRYDTQIKKTFAIYADFESILDTDIKNRKKGEKTELQSQHKIVAFGAMFVSKYEKFSEPPELYIGENVIKHFVLYLNRIKKKVENILEEYPRIQLEDVVVTQKDKIRLEKQDRCYLCNIKFTEKIRKVMDHAHLGYEGKNRDLNYACNRCNITHSSLKMETMRIPIIMHNLTGYDSHFLIQNLYKYIEGEIRILPLTSEKFTAIYIDKFVFIDSARFLQNSLSNLADLVASKNIENMHFTSKYLKNKSLLKYVIRKQVLPYDYLDSRERLMEKSLPAHKYFYNSLNNRNITLEEYKFALKMFKLFECKNIEDYLKEYLKIDVLLLADVFENFRENTLDFYSLDPCYYVSSPSLCYNAMLKYCKIELDLMHDFDMFMFIERGMRGGITNVSQRYAKCNLKNSHIIYLDATNLYGNSMCDALPVGNFEWVDPTKMAIENILNHKDDSNIGYILDVDLIYPKEIHDLHNMYPLAPEKKNVEEKCLSQYNRSILEKFSKKYVKSAKLLATLEDKQNYVIHYRNLKLYTQLGMKIKKINKILRFDQSKWMAPYIHKNNTERAKATSEFDKKIFKNSNNCVYGKCLENVRKRINLRLISDPKKIEKLIEQPNFVNSISLSHDLVSIISKKKSVKFDKPIFVGFTILELSKLHMYDFHYNKMLKWFPDIQLCYTDTDSLIYKINDENYEKILYSNSDYFDFSNYDKNHKLYNTKNKCVMGKFKDESAGRNIKEFVGLRPKLYSIKYEDEKEFHKMKGVKTQFSTHINHSLYKKCLKRDLQLNLNYLAIRSFKHKVYTIKNSKIALSTDDSKRYILKNGISTLAYGNYNIAKIKKK